METYHNTIRSILYIIFLILGYVIPILGIIPILYLEYKLREVKDEDLQQIKNWIKFGIALQLLYIILLMLIIILFTPIHS